MTIKAPARLRKEPVANQASAEPRARPDNWNRLDEISKLRAVILDEEARKPAKKRPGERRCLTCGKVFVSAWCGNRTCAPCEREAEGR